MKNHHGKLTSVPLHICPKVKLLDKVPEMLKGFQKICILLSNIFHKTQTLLLQSFPCMLSLTQRNYLSDRGSAGKDITGQLTVLSPILSIQTVKKKEANTQWRVPRI